MDASAAVQLGATSSPAPPRLTRAFVQPEGPSPTQSTPIPPPVLLCSRQAPPSSPPAAAEATPPPVADATPSHAAMSHYAESERGGRTRSRVQGGRSGHIAPDNADPVGELSSFPLIPCPDCGLARVIEGRTKKEGANHGRLFFKCARNAVSCWLLCFPP